jgi:hydroquinone glucosyltransferase
VILLCSPCIGHLIPFVELARRLVADHGLAATVLFASATPSPSREYLAVAAAVPEGVDLVALPADDDAALALPPSASVRDRIAHAVACSLPRVLRAARSLPPPLAALVADATGAAAALGVAAELRLPLHVFFTSPWALLSLILHLPELDAALPRDGEFRDDATTAAGPMMIRLPGCAPIAASDLPSPMLAGRSSVAYTRYLHAAEAYRKVDGFLVNTFQDIEPAVVDGGCGLSKLPPVHAVGPLVLMTRPATVARDDECLRWLDQQPRGSVVHVSFGSGGTLTWQQTAELALGLEKSGQRFIWVVKRPSEDPLGCGSFFGTPPTQAQAGATLDFLPEGFLERTRGVGLVLESWAPQAAVLSHPSTGCFVTHCGWNSVLESIQNGVPLIAWPLYAEQRMNAATLEAELGVAIRVKLGQGGLVCRQEVARVIDCVLNKDDGRTLRKRMCELKDKAVRALSAEGSSTHAIAQVAELWRSGSSSHAN